MELTRARVREANSRTEPVLTMIEMSDVLLSLWSD